MKMVEPSHWQSAYIQEFGNGRNVFGYEVLENESIYLESMLWEGAYTHTHTNTHRLVDVLHKYHCSHLPVLESSTQGEIAHRSGRDTRRLATLWEGPQ